MDTLTRTDELARAHGFESYDQYLRTRQWRRLRDRMLRLSGRRCEWVTHGARCARRHRLHVHHLTYDRFPFREEPDDLLVVCQAHHNEAHGRRPTPAPTAQPSSVVRDLWPFLVVAVVGVWFLAGGWPSWAQVGVAGEYVAAVAALTVRIIVGVAWWALGVGVGWLAERVG